MNEKKSVSVVRENRRRVIWIIALFLLLVEISLPQIRPQKSGININSPFYNITDQDIEFLYDLTFMSDSVRETEQEIFAAIYAMIDSAREFIVLDLFLFGYTTFENNPQFIDIAGELTNRLIAKRKRSPDIPIYFITDEFNGLYYSYQPRHLEMLAESGVEIIMTDMTCMPNSNWAYSIFWHLIPRWTGNPNYKGWLPNIFGDPDHKMALRSFLKLLNFKANHRKVVVTDQQALITSANPHTASSLHFNIAFLIKGAIIGEILRSEIDVGRLSGSQIAGAKYTSRHNGEIRIKYLTEKKIGESVIAEIDNTSKGDTVDLAMFYISDRKLVRALKRALGREVYLRTLLDANKDAFGRIKKGIPNRQVARELYEAGAQIKWANTNGEQFHTKLVIITRADIITILGGSANLTRRNLRGYNLESEVMIIAPRGSRVAKEVKGYFEMLWHDEMYALDYSNFTDRSPWRYFRYRFQEWSGMSSF